MFVSKGHKILFSKFLKILEKTKTDVDRLLLVSKFEKSSILAKYIGKFIFIVKTKIRVFTSVSIFSNTILQILKTKFYVFRTQICRNWSKLFI